MSLYTSFVANVLFPLHEKLKGHDTVRLRQAMDDSQWWAPAQLEALRLERLRKLLIHAGQHVPYYRDLFAGSGFTRTTCALSTISGACLSLTRLSFDMRASA